MTDIIKLNIILYYADYLAIRNSSRQVTDNCKYYYIYEAPMNLAYLCNSAPFYDEEDKYYIQSCQDIQRIINKAGINEAKNFVNGICNLKVMGCVDAKLMLRQVHLFSTNIDRNTAFRDYERWLKTQHYSHLLMDDGGEIHRVKCTRYVAHRDRNNEYKSKLNYYEGEFKNEEEQVQGQEDKTA